MKDRRTQPSFHRETKGCVQVFSQRERCASTTVLASRHNQKRGGVRGLTEKHRKLSKRHLVRCHCFPLQAHMAQVKKQNKTKNKQKKKTKQKNTQCMCVLSP